MPSEEKPTIPQSVLDLIERFERNRDAYKSGSYNETQARREFIDPLFKALGWDMDNEQGYAEAYKDVIHEDAIKVGEATKAPDYGFRIGGARKFFLEAKKPAVDIENDASPAFQLRRYGWTTKLPLSILTDFEAFAVYDCRFKPDQKDSAAVGRILYIPCTEYAARWHEIAGIFSRDAVLKGSFDKFAESTKAKRGTAAVDDAFLETIETWRKELAENLALRNKQLSQRELNFAVQRIIDRIIFLRICEGRGIEDYGRLRAVAEGDRIYSRLGKLFEQADDRYNSGLFHFRAEKGRHEAPDELTLGLDLDDKLLRGILKSLYYPECPYVFSALPADVLGQVYEQFLGKVIRLTEGHRAKVDDKPEVKKAGGVFYTPTYIVEYIVQNTIGKLLEGKTPKQAAMLKILDPACGSGSFSLGAYEHLLKWHLDFYTKNDPARWAKGSKPVLVQTSSGSWKLTIAERKRILLDNIYGVDIDAQAVETTKLSLLLKVLEGETSQTIQPELLHERALPDLSNNIKCGNSLIGPDFYQQQQMALLDEEERYRVNVFDCHKEFPEIFKAGGFDAVIGNPPWGAALSKLEKDYLVRYSCFQGNHDSYLFFIERANSLLKDEGRLSYVTPDSWIKVPQAMKLRLFVLENFDVSTITVLPQKVFSGVSANCIVFLLQKSKKLNSCSVNILHPRSELVRLVLGEFDDCYVVKPNGWTDSKDKQFQIFQNDQTTLILNHARAQCSDAINYLDVMQGIVPYSSEQHSQETIKNRKFHADRKLSDEYDLWIQGRTITRYSIKLKDSEYLRYGPWLHRARKPKYFQGPRILVQEITGGHPPRISACFYEKVVYHDPGIISCLVVGDLNVNFLLGIINSKFLSWYHRYASPKGTRSLFPKVLIGDIRSFPLPNIQLNNSADKSRHDQMVKLVEQILELHKRLSAANTPQEKTSLDRQIAATDTQIDRLVYDLYGLTANEIKVVEGNA